MTEEKKYVAVASYLTTSVMIEQIRKRKITKNQQSGIPQPADVEVDLTVCNPPCCLTVRTNWVS